MDKRIHNHGKIKHGLRENKLYTTWCNIRSRCNKSYNPYYHNYGKRGITVCEEWDNTNNGFINFYNWAISHDYHEELSIDRINNDEGYNPKNCRWVDRKFQNSNKRNNTIFEYKGVKDTLTNLCRQNDKYRKTIHWRIYKMGLSISEAMELPLSHGFVEGY
jgi:hypothetical protein